LNSFLAAFFKIVEENYQMSCYVIMFKNRIFSDQSEEFEGLSHRGTSSRRDSSVGREGGSRRNSIHYIEEHTDEALEELIAGMSDEEQDSSILNAIAKVPFRQSGKNQSEQVCRKYLFDGRCDNSTCRYTHTWKKMMEERARIIKEWGGVLGPNFEGLSEMKKKSEQTTNLRRGFPGQEPGRVRLIDALENEGDQGEDAEETSQFGCHLVASLMATGHTSKTWRASHKIASVSTEDGKSLKYPVVVLFDSGASGGNYVF
jgi:hypothetical protein